VPAAALVALAGLVVLLLVAAVIVTALPGPDGRADGDRQVAPERQRPGGDEARLRFGGLVLEEHAVGVTVTYPELVLEADADGPVAIFVFGERLRDDAASLIDTVVQYGIEPVLISGDRRSPVHAVASMLGIERALAHQTPHSKCEWIVGQQRAGHTVAMLGDGINDGPALARADVSIAMADGSATAQARADLILQSSRLMDMEYAFILSRRAMRLVRQNLTLALICNVCLVAFAALGVASPALAVAGTLLSSLLVLANAGRLLRSDSRPGRSKRSRDRSFAAPSASAG